MAKRTENAERRRDAERQHRRQHILLAAERVFGRLPHDEASMQKIAAEAGIGMKGLYQHFASKDELLTAVVGFRLGEIDECLKAARQAGDPIKHLRSFGVSYAAFFLERPQFFPLFRMQKICVDWKLGSRFTEPTRFGLKQIEADVAKVMDAGVKAGRLAAVDPKLLAAIAVGFFISVTQYLLLTKRPASADDSADELLGLLLNGIGKTP
jgi:AcrR family transcriptional regulator